MKLLILNLLTTLCYTTNAQDVFPKQGDVANAIIWNAASGNISYNFSSVNKKKNERYFSLNYNYKKVLNDFLNEKKHTKICFSW